MYDNHLQADQEWNGTRSNTRRRTLADADRGSIIKGRVVLLSDFNVNSTDWNVHCGEIRNVAGLRRMVEKYRLILNNKPRKPTRNKWRRMR